MEYVDFDATTGRWIGHFLERLQRGKRVINPEEAAILNLLRVIVDRKLLLILHSERKLPKWNDGAGGGPAG